MRTITRLAAAVLALGLLVAACGDDDDTSTATTSAARAFCDDREELRTDLKGLTDFDVLKSGTDALREQFDKVRDDVSALRESAKEAAPEEVAALDQAVTDLETALEALGNGEITAANARDAIAAIGRIGTSGQELLSTLDSLC